MRLRTRVLTGFAALLAIVVVAGAAVVVTQRNQLVEQLDRRLLAIVPLERPQPPEDLVAPPPDAPAQPVAGRDGDKPISDLYLAEVGADGDVSVVVEGQLLSTTPDVAGLVDLDDLDDGEPVERTFLTVDGVDGDTTFRVLLNPSPDRSETLLVAVPLTDVDETVDRLVITFVVAVVLLVAVLALLALWIIRLGLRPVASVAATAREVASGDRSRRAPAVDERTEAGELASAFNLMLDQRDEAEDRLRQFASDASHELRTPLTSIRGYLDLYAAGGFREEGQLDDVVRRMQDEASRMNALVEELLQLARFDEGRELERSEVDLRSLADDVVANATAAHPGRTISVQPGSAERVLASVDAARITQLLTLLVDNAITHAPDASVHLEVAAADDAVRLCVVDDGPGLDDEQAAQVFTRFFRGDGSRSRATGGSGLGLSIARAIVDAHGGDIELVTAPGDGCRFDITLPTS